MRLLNLFRKGKDQEKPQFFKRQYEKDLKDLQLPPPYISFTNRVLEQQVLGEKSQLFYYIPVYLNFKIKSIQNVNIQQLTGSINCVIIITLCLEQLPQYIKDIINQQFTIQLNRSEILCLGTTEDNSVSKGGSKNIPVYTLRKTLSASIVEDTFWSPFEIVRLIISVTFNSIKISGKEIVKRAKLNEKKYDQIIDESRTFNISFNCMRNNAEIPINYSSGCVYSVYDLAENLLESYHINHDSYAEVIRQYKDPTPQPIYKSNKGKNKAKKQQSLLESPTKSVNVDNLERTCSDSQKNLFVAPKIAYYTKDECLSHIQKSIPELYRNKIQEKDYYKPNYFQYTHLVIPLYKYPGNALATIFVPLFLLALLSLAIFFQNNDLSERIGSIATMVLGYIALIPSIKQQLPPNASITIIERVIYISTLCCLFPLFESFMVDSIEGYQFVWQCNFGFLFCIGTHMIVFVFVFFLILVHKLYWEPSYNNSFEMPNVKLSTHRLEWTNPYCDEEFFKTNRRIYEENMSNQNLTRLMIKGSVSSQKVHHLQSKTSITTQTYIQNFKLMDEIINDGRHVDVSVKQRSITKVKEN